MKTINTASNIILRLVGVVFLISGIITISTSLSGEKTQEEIEISYEISSPIEFYNEYEANEVQANTKYENQWVEIIGEVKEINVLLNKPYVTLSLGHLSYDKIMCIYESDSSDVVSNLKKGDMIKVTGKVDGYSISTVTIRRCTIENYEEDRTPQFEVTTTDILEEYRQNEIVAREKYLGKCVKIVGSIDEISQDVFGDRYIKLEDGKQYSWDSVSCYYLDGMDISQLSKGDTISVIGFVEDKNYSGIQVTRVTLAE